jgi:capsular polysaccharide biosynthesis protein
MSEQALDLRRAMQLLWRRKRVLLIFAAVGLLLGSVYTASKPPAPVGQALVLLPSGIKDESTQAVIASSDAVLQNVRLSVDRNLTLEELRKKIIVKELTSNVLAISATGPNASDTEELANTVAASYINLMTRTDSPGGPLRVGLLQRASNATQTPLVAALLETEAIGILLALVIGSIVVLARSRRDKRLRERDEIADSIGVAVLASVPVAHPVDAAGWTRLLEKYEPAVVNAWRLRTVLRELGLGPGSTGSTGSGNGASGNGASGNGASGDGVSVAVLSLSTDPRALALGPQLAVFATSLGIRTALVVTPHPEAGVSAALQTACAAPMPEGSRRSADLQVTVGEQADAGLAAVGLTVVVAVVDPSRPEIADLKLTTMTVLGVSAGAATAADLARVAVSAADAGRHVSGILVADPFSTDRTTGRLPQLARSAQRQQPTRLTGTKTGAGARR